MVRVTMQALSLPKTNVTSEIGEGNSMVNRQSMCLLDERGLEAPNPLTLDNPHDLDHRLWNSHYVKLCADYWREPSIYYCV